MAKITPNPNVPKGVAQNRRTIKKIAPEEFDSIRAKLQPGETLRKDGTLMYRPPKSVYDGPETINPLYANSLEQLRQKEFKLLSALQEQLSMRDSKCTVNDMYKKWKGLKRGIRDSTLSNYIYMYEHFVMPSKLGRMFIRLVKKSDIKQFYNSLVDQKSLKVNTLGNVHGVLLQVFALAQEDRIINFNPVEKALAELRRSYADSQEDRIALTLAEQHHFLKCIKDEPNWTNVFLVLLGTGMRAGELCGLQWGDIDFDENKITVAHNLVYYAHASNNSKSWYNVHEPKSKASRRVLFMFPFVREALLREKERQEKQNVRCCQAVDGYDDFVFLNRFNMPFHHSTLNSAIRRLVLKYNTKILESKLPESKKITLPIFTCHVLRHTCATRLIENEVNPVAVQSLLGHSSLNITMGVYVSCTESFKKKALGMQDENNYPDIFKDALGLMREERPKAENDLIKQYLPRTSSTELEVLTHFYTEYTQNNPKPMISYDNV